MVAEHLATILGLDAPIRLRQNCIELDLMDGDEAEPGSSQTSMSTADPWAAVASALPPETPPPRSGSWAAAASTALPEAPLSRLARPGYAPMAAIGPELPQGALASRNHGAAAQSDYDKGDDSSHDQWSFETWEDWERRHWLPDGSRAAWRWLPGGTWAGPRNTRWEEDNSSTWQHLPSVAAGSLNQGSWQGSAASSRDFTVPPACRKGSGEVIIASGAERC